MSFVTATGKITRTTTLRDTVWTAIHDTFPARQVAGLAKPIKLLDVIKAGQSQCRENLTAGYCPHLCVSRFLDGQLEESTECSLQMT